MPQLIKAYKSRHTRDISLGMFSIFTVGITLWLIYGFMRADTPIIIANSITLILSGAILALKIRYK